LATKNGRRHRTGTLELIVAAVEQRPPFTRLRGIESYPDVPFVDEDGETLRNARASIPLRCRPQDRAPTNCSGGCVTPPPGTSGSCSICF
jgi:hypothetical protein